MITKEQKLEYQKMTQEKLNHELINACMFDRLEIVQYLLTSPDLLEHADIHVNDDATFVNLCIQKNIKTITYLIFDYKIEYTQCIQKYLNENNRDNIIDMFNTRELEKKLQLIYNNMKYNELNKALINACIFDRLDVVKYLLTSPDLKKNGDIHYYEDEPLISASKQGNLEIVKYLLTSPDLKHQANIHAQIDAPLFNACMFGRLEIVQYLLTSTELKEHADIHADNDHAFLNACIYDRIDIIKYFIFDYKIEKTDCIEKYLMKKNQQDILHMFEKRELEEKLRLELKNNSNIIYNIKL